MEPKRALAVFKSATSVQAEPFQDSVLADTLGFASLPAYAMAAVLDAPDPPKFHLAEFKSAISVHDDPFHDSTSVSLPPVPASAPLIANHEVAIPADPKPRLAVFVAGEVAQAPADVTA